MRFKQQINIIRRESVPDLNAVEKALLELRELRRSTRWLPWFFYKFIAPYLVTGFISLCVGLATLYVLKKTNIISAAKDNLAATEKVIQVKQFILDTTSKGLDNVRANIKSTSYSLDSTRRLYNSAKSTLARLQEALSSKDATFNGVRKIVDSLSDQIKNASIHNDDVSNQLKRNKTESTLMRNTIEGGKDVMGEVKYLMQDIRQSIRSQNCNVDTSRFGVINYYINTFFVRENELYQIK